MDLKKVSLGVASFMGWYFLVGTFSLDTNFGNYYYFFAFRSENEVCASSDTPLSLGGILRCALNNKKHGSCNSMVLGICFL